VLLPLVVALLVSRRRGLAAEDDHVEKRAAEEDCVRSGQLGVEQGQLRRAIEGIREERGLDHDQQVLRILPVENLSVVSRLVGAGVEQLEELGLTKGGGKLREQAELWRQSEGAGIIQH